jgi:hypothetical protein
MGHRANLIVVENGTYDLYYTHWGAVTLPGDLFWGPDHAVRFIRMQAPVDESGWLDDIWAEGGAVVDRDRRVLLLYGGEGLLYDAPYRHVYMDLLARVWAPWEVRWAYEGIADLADHVGYPREKVLADDEDGGIRSLAPTENMQWIDTVASVRFPDGALRLYPLTGDPEWFLYSGPPLLETVDPRQGFDRLALEEPDRYFPMGGFHIDIATKTVDYWTTKDVPGAPARVAARWPDWTMRWHHDAYQSQLDRTGGLLRFPVASRTSLEQHLRSMLLAESAYSPVDTLLRLIGEEQEKGKDVQVNLWALQDDRLELSVDVRRRILDTVLPPPDNMT